MKACVRSLHRLEVRHRTPWNFHYLPLVPLQKVLTFKGNFHRIYKTLYAPRICLFFAPSTRLSLLSLSDAKTPNLVFLLVHFISGARFLVVTLMFCTISDGPWSFLLYTFSTCSSTDWLLNWGMKRTHPRLTILFCLHISINELPFSVMFAVHIQVRPGFVTADALAEEENSENPRKPCQGVIPFFARRTADEPAPQAFFLSFIP
jgi:hypothetical protein